MKKLFFNLYFWPAFCVATITGILLLPFTLLLQRLLHNRGLSASLRRAIRFYGWFLVCVVPFLKPVTIDDQTNGLPLPAIFTPNHSSSIDPYLFGALRIENCFVTSWPFKIPVYSFFMKLAGYVNSNDGWESVKNQSLRVLQSGSSITIWPEGHRSRNGHLLRFRNGAFRLAVETGYPILPVCILGSAHVLPPGSRLLNPGEVKLILLPPIYPPGKITDIHEAVSHLKKEAKTVISTVLTQKKESSHLPLHPFPNNKSNLDDHHAKSHSAS